MSKAIFSPIETKILRLIRNNPVAVGRAMVALYKRQTADEQRAGVTVHTNGRGFSAADASKGTRYARWVLAGNQLTGPYLAHAQELARKYLGQLVEIAADNRVMTRRDALAKAANAEWEALESAKFN